jgi:large subunit ribosomal protein L35
MPKLKTHKAAVKRLKISANGKLLRTKGLRGHLRRRRAKRNKELYDKLLNVAPADVKRLKQLLPYGTP